MGQPAGRTARSGGGTGKRGGSRSGDDVSEDGAGGHRPAVLALPVDLARSLRHLDDADLDRLVEAATAEARRRGRRAGKTAGGRACAKPAPVTQGQEKLILAVFEASLKPAAIAREFRLARSGRRGAGRRRTRPPVSGRLTATTPSAARSPAPAARPDGPLHRRLARLAPVYPHMGRRPHHRELPKAHHGFRCRQDRKEASLLPRVEGRRSGGLAGGQEDGPRSRLRRRGSGPCQVRGP